MPKVVHFLPTFWKSEVCSQTVLPDRSLIIRQNWLKMPKCNIFDDFETHWSWMSFRISEFSWVSKVNWALTLVSNTFEKRMWRKTVKKVSKSRKAESIACPIILRFYRYFLFFLSRWACWKRPHPNVDQLSVWSKTTSLLVASSPLSNHWVIIMPGEHRNGNGKWSQQKVYGTTDSTIEVLAEEQNSTSCFSQ